MKDRMIHCSCDNIDVLEATLDGKNTFHCMQMMVWERGPPPQQGQAVTGKKLTRSRAIMADALQEFQMLEEATLPTGLHHRSVDTRKLRWNG